MAPSSDQLPLDVNYAKLAEWLVGVCLVLAEKCHHYISTHPQSFHVSDGSMRVALGQTSRRKLPQDWHRKMQGIQLKAGEAAQSLPARLKREDESSAVDYLLVKQTCESLAESSERNLFGALTGPASVWDKIVRAYEKESECSETNIFLTAFHEECSRSCTGPSLLCCHVDIYLGECSLTLARNVDYEIPFYKRQKGKYQQQLLDLERKQTEHLHSAALAARSYQEVASALRAINLTHALLLKAIRRCPESSDFP